jgi:hypothetical protein
MKQFSVKDAAKFSPDSVYVLGQLNPINVPTVVDPVDTLMSQLLLSEC